VSRDGLVGAAVRYGAAGLVNTAVGFSVIALLDFGLGVNPFVANAAGYAVAVGLGFVLGREFVFRDRGRVAPAGARYVVAVILAFGLNQLMLALARMALPDETWGGAAAQLAGMATYTASLFLLARFWVFRGGAPDRV
jgi:putative flippase GtrA